METPAFDPNILAAPFVICCIIAAIIAWFMMLVGSLKLSFSLTTNEAPSYLRCIVMLLLIIVGNIAVFAGLYFAVGSQPWYIITCYQAIVQITLMMIVARCNPFSAFFASLCHTVFSSIGTVVIALVFLLVCGSALDGVEQRKREASPGGNSQSVSKSWFGRYDTGRDDGWKKNPRLRPGRFSSNPFIE